MSTTTSGPAKGATGIPPPKRFPCPPPSCCGCMSRWCSFVASNWRRRTSYKKGEMPGFIHLYIGEEATAIGVCAHLHNDDWITSTHRGHGHALAKGVPPN